MVSKVNKGKGVTSSSHGNKRVGPGFEEPFDDDDATNEDQARVDSDLESDDDKDDSEIGEAAFAPTYNDD
ncbi:hypothetical protein HAX54_021066 [Datura stramonium]|uniref:Uncharacterized protein n=1 Tax=Datura stramonium TaxID=4076 RepID=A0ABS8S6H1_DATST|nr:hypothetical protein [Datura stramonium]